MFIIAHGGGGLKTAKKPRVNSIESFLVHYAAGTRVFEFDVMLTSDGHIILTHEFEEYLEYLSRKKKYTINQYKYYNENLLSFERIIELMVKYPDIIILVDTKEDDHKTIDLYYKLNDMIKNTNEELFKRIVPQVYSEIVYKHVNAHCEFEKYIFAIYKTKQSVKDIRNIVKKYDNIYAITGGVKDFRTYLLSLFKGKKSMFVFTINSWFLKQILKLFRVDAIYSDYLYQGKKR